MNVNSQTETLQTTLQAPQVLVLKPMHLFLLLICAENIEVKMSPDVKNKECIIF